MNRLVDRRLFLGAGAAAVGLLMTACTDTKRPEYSLGAGEPGGFFSEFTALLAHTVDTAGADFRLSPRPSAGTAENLDLLRSGAVDLALALGDAAVVAPEGVQSIGRLYQNYFQLAVPAESPIRSMAELKGKVVSLGPDNSGTQFTGLRILEASGLTTGNITMRPVALTDVTSAMARGEIQAALFAGGIPVLAVDPQASAQGSTAIRLIDLSAEQRVLSERFGGVYAAADIPAGIYGSSAGVGTIGVASLLLARPDIPAAVAGRIVEILVTRAADLIPAGALGAQYLDARSLISTSGIPLHPGAAEAYRRLHG
ncbi:TAXI family TRAP transporter solute-binding subunit [Pseudarthrobacter sulfonivorans]|uniref:TAXI family TRAP transporter solute-binding subunit n=1 Tax=Pseudarthrobacter sulfonivorans TaxID=121292 RepID=UPI0028632F82|nr:TAXI family TRAP transporter solute-binding subunit [Pseudarthrobacter sulfonivorans]MDR6415715.1 TRAP transporter TAXI family solute receptor [Pseudarthrobacter sulfonivorans]